MTANRFEGGCHCGGIRYVFTTKRPPAEWPVRRCTCSYCSRLGARYTSGADTQLDVVVQDASLAGRYEFGTKTAQFFRCARCGVMNFAHCKIGETTYAVLNVNTLDDVDTLDLHVADADFEGEDVAQRLDRRQRNWIPRVSLRFVNT